MADAELGTVVLHPAASLVFTLSHWKGRQYAHVRKFISTDKYTGPTKSGLLLGGDVLVEVIDALCRLQSAVPGVHGQEFARISKRGGVEIVISTIDPDDLQALPGVDIREHVDTPGYTGPTKKGIRFNWEKLPEVIALMRIQAGRLGADYNQQPTLFPDTKLQWVEEATTVAEAAATPPSDGIRSPHSPVAPHHLAVPATPQSPPSGRATRRVCRCLASAGCAMGRTGPVEARADHGPAEPGFRCSGGVWRKFRSVGRDMSYPSAMLGMVRQRRRLGHGQTSDLVCTPRFGEVAA